jgi:hypothetical protein
LLIRFRFSPSSLLLALVVLYIILLNLCYLFVIIILDGFCRGDTGIVSQNYNGVIGHRCADYSQEIIYFGLQNVQTDPEA